MYNPIRTIRRIFARETEPTPAVEPVDVIALALFTAELNAAQDGTAVSMLDVNGVIIVNVLLTEGGFRYQLADQYDATAWLIYEDAYDILLECAQGLR